MIASDSKQGDSVKHRQIKSYVVRSSKIADKYKDALEKYGSKYLISDTNLEGIFDEPPFSKNSVSENSAPKRREIILEIGSGQGATLISAAKEKPDTYFLGTDVYLQGLAHTIYTAQKNNLQNIRLYQGDVNDILKAAPEKFFSEIWCFFPDPWHKRKHTKRRLIQEDFLDLASKKLACKKLSGSFRVATDNEDYKNQLLKLGFLQAPRFAFRPITTFEAKALKANRKVFDLTYNFKNPT
ncbi:MAG: methyltransferase [Bifidobacteriaceae bacterium]|jgi:tRNA (guanine-N7-)-methyltransferase|nr:methyltransferase [Bifidobacteriaceae bacterium]